ncbi:Protein HIRA, partial [Geodia barretti]
VSHDGNPIFSVAIHPDGSRFATGGQGKDSGVVVIWNMAPVRSAADEANEAIPKVLCEMSNHLGCVNCVRWSVDGKWLASGGDDAIVMIWSVKYQGGGGGGASLGFGTDLERWGCIHMLRGHNGDVLDLSWSPDQKYLASCSVDNTIIIWNARELPQKVSTVAGHRGLVKGITWDPVGKYLASQSDDRSVRIWRTSDWCEEKVITEPFRRCGGTTHILRLSWSPDGRYIVSAHALNNDGPTAQIIERGDWKMGVDLVGHRKAVEVVSFNPHLFFNDRSSKESNHGCIAVGSRDRSLSIWLTSLKRPLVVTHDMFVDSIIDIAWSCDGYELMVASTDGSLGYLSFSQKELGVRLPKQALDNLFLEIYGCARASLGHSLSDQGETKTSDQRPSGLEVQLLSPPAKPISFEPLSPKPSKTKPLAPPISPSSTKPSHKRRLLDTEASGDPLPRAKRQKKHRSLDPASPPQSKPPCTPQKGSGSSSAVTSSHTKSTSTLVLLPVPTPQSTLTVQLVAGIGAGAGVAGGEPLNLEVDNTRPKCCTVTCKRGADVKWRSSLLSRGLIATGNHCITCVVCEDHTMSVFSSQSGRMLLARFSTPAPPHDVKVSGYCAMLVTADASVRVWDMQKTELLVRDTSFAHLLKRSEKVSLSSCNLAPVGTPILSLSDSTSYLYHSGMGVWMEVSNANENTEIRGGIAADFEATTSMELAHLQRIQSAALSSHHPTTGQCLTRLRDTDGKLATASFLESQISRSLSLQSPVEHQHWCRVYVKFLVREGLEERLREFCMQFCRPGGGGGEGGVVLGFGVRGMARDFLSDIAGNAKLQRLYCELRDALDSPSQ